MQIIHLVRHAHPDADFALRYLGRTDAPLSAAGRAAAEAMRNAFEECGDVPVFSSPLRRAYDTARILSGRAPLIEPLLVEFSFGALDGLLPAEAEALYPEAYAHLCKNPLDASPFGGDDWASVQNRVKVFVDRVGQQSCIVVGHQLSLIALIQMLGAASIFAVDAIALAYAGSVSLARNGASWRQVETR